MESEGEIGGEIFPVLDDVGWRFVDSPIMLDTCASTENPPFSVVAKLLRVPLLA